MRRPVAVFEGLWRCAILLLLAVLVAYAVRIDRNEQRMLQDFPDIAQSASDDRADSAKQSEEQLDALKEIQANTEMLAIGR